MIDNLPLFHRISGQPVIVLGSGEAAKAKRRLVERAGGVVVGDVQEGIDKSARLAFVAHDDTEAAQADAIRLRAAGILVNATDRLELCDFVVPSILDRSPVLLAVGTGGASAGLAKALRLRLETLLPQSLGRLALALGAARDRLRARWPDAGARRRALDEALGKGGALDPLREDAGTLLGDWLDSPNIEVSENSLVELALRSADPEDLTLREARLLGSADMIVHETGVSSAILDRARADATRVEIETGAPAPDTSGLAVLLRL